ncbi:MAG TPA: hypothetical protein VK464_14070 [Symbiobacteriaceae bacterium]|nr:hypothetical protein [Symbiobacteriaceae bacterium]
MLTSALGDLLSERRYGECRELAETILRRGSLTDGERGIVYLALSSSLAALHSNQEALGPGELAVYFSRCAGEHDLLGRALCHLAEVYHENGLYKRAVGCLDEYFLAFSLYNLARALEGRAFGQMAQSYQAMGRGPKALEYWRKAYRWHMDHRTDPQLVDLYRGKLVWQLLKLGQLEPVGALLGDSEAYLRQAPNDLEARARYLNNLAYQAYLTCRYGLAIDTAARVMGLRGARPVRKAQACLTLHYTARSLGLVREAVGFGLLGRIQASVARRPDLEDEATRALVHMHQRETLPSIDELLRGLGRRPGSSGAAG